MKKTIIFSLSLLIFLSSCKKDDSDNSSNGNGTITCTIDGINTSFDTEARAIKTDVTGAYSVQIIGYKGTAGNSDQIAIGIASDLAIATGTYSEDGSTGNKLASVNYMPSGSSYPYISNNSTSNPSTVTVTAISATSIQGTFKGDVYLTSNNGTTTTKKVISNGQFNVNF
ncbi:MAG TPA: hypothetical protein VIQ00_05435 [Chitinophagaceae bacterium]|jgi:hypothetical protein